MHLGKIGELRQLYCGTVQLKVRRAKLGQVMSMFNTVSMSQQYILPTRFVPELYARQLSSGVHQPLPE